MEKKIEIYVRLLNEGVGVSRPTRALVLENGFYKILPIPDYGFADEKWEFSPGSIVKGEMRHDDSGPYLLAVIK